MLLYLLRKILLFLVALWAIVSVVFFLSRTLPGSAESRLFNSAAESTTGVGGQQAQKQAYRHYLQRTRQNLPLFYIGMASAAEPDTLYRIWPEADRQALQELVFIYGNWPQISAFYQKVQGLQSAILQYEPAGPRLQQLSGSLIMLPATAVKARLAGLRQHIQHPETKRQALETEKAFKNVTATATPANVKWPVLHWYGPENQYHYWLSDLVVLNLGQSDRDKRPVTSAVGEAFANTLVLLLLSIIFSFTLAVLLSLWLVKERSRKWRKPVLAFLYGLDSIPVFIVALLLVLFFAGSYFLDLFPVYGLGEADTEGLSLWEWAGLHLYHITLPVICLVLVTLPYLTAQVYQALQAVMQTDFIRTAKAKGLPENVIIRRHAFRNVWLPLITLLSDYLPGLVAGALVIEVIFSIPGMGRLLAEAVLARDYAIITGVVLVVAAFRMLCYLLADVFYFIADPRTRQAV